MCVRVRNVHKSMNELLKELSDLNLITYGHCVSGQNKWVINSERLNIIKITLRLKSSLLLDL